MAGVLLHEGISRGSPPTIEVLSIGAITSVRRSEDMLPYLPTFRQFFVPLPRTAAEMTLKAIKVFLVDLECVTKTTVKVRGPMLYLKIRKGIDTLYRSIL